MSESQGRLVQDGDLAQLLQVGAQDLSSLNPTERMRVRLWFFEMLRNSEQTTLFAWQGALDPDVYGRWRQSLLNLLDRWPELSVYLDQNRDLFDPAFVTMCRGDDGEKEEAAPDG